MLDDAIDACLWVREHVTDRMILAGSSAGSLLAVATAAHPRAPKALAVLSIYGMLDLTSRRYIEPGTPLIGPPMSDASSVLKVIEVATRDGLAIDGYAFPQDLMADIRFGWVRIMHQEAVIPDILTRTPGLSKRIESIGVEAIPPKFRTLFPVTFGLSPGFPPTAFLHGDSDPFVDFNQSERVAKRLEDFGVKTLLEKVKGKGHGFDVMEISGDVEIEVGNREDQEVYNGMRRILKFLDAAAG